ncbi:hypothetical protein [Lactobacillus sp. PV034]|uniref:P8 family protein n=1 Tax=Lactobacillus sp. PV034 TaxID=2594495 RepID=UPI002240E33E|nr:hypothetical protein [Lactobacillus sp. PV034]QNQ81404.1 hypothetical protein FP432_07455 [Lactobacillus sp. PV034]
MTKIDNLSWLDNQMTEIFSWSDDESSVREFLWKYYLEQAGNDTVRAEGLMLNLLNQGDEKIKQVIEEIKK